MDTLVLCDTSILIPSFIKDHTHHEDTFPFFEKIVEGKINAALCAHSFAEFYASSTAMPSSSPISTEQAVQIIEDHLLKVFLTVELKQSDYLEALHWVAQKGLRSGAIYDALIFQAARKKKISTLVTWNIKHFERLSKGEIRILTPQELL